MENEILKKSLIIFVFLTFVFIQNKSTVLSSINTDENKSSLPEFLSSYELIENYQWLEDNLSSVEKVVANDLSINRLKEERGYKNAVFASAMDNLPPTLPASVDNSLLKCFPPIGDQGVLGSCAAFNTTYYQLTHTIAMENGWNVKDDVDNTKKFSPKWTFNLTNSGQNSSMSIFNSYKLFMNSGAAIWSEFPYMKDDSDAKNYLEWPTDGEVWRNALNYRIEDYGYLEVWDENDPDTPVKSPESESLTNVKQFLSNGHVLVFETNITGWNFDTVLNDPSTNQENSFEGEYIAYANGKSSLSVDGHVMTLVGYNDDIWVDINGNGKIDPGEKGAFKVANSWGTAEISEFSNTDFTWYSNEGFVWLAYDALNKISAVEDSPFIPERRNVWRYNNYVYWITAKAGYTPKFLVEYTISTSNRYNVKKLFGFSNPDTYTPVTFWDPGSINSYSRVSMEKMAFDGTENECDATFVFDLTHIYDMYDNKEGNWYFSIIDEGAGNDGILKELKFIDLANDKEYYYEENIPYKFSNESINFGPIRIKKNTLNSSGCFLNRAIPFEEQHFQTAVLNDKIYAVGGYEPFDGFVSTLYEYSPNEDTWKLKSELPGKTASLIYITQLDEEIYTMRKIIEENDIKENDIKENDIKENDIKENDIKENDIKENDIEKEFKWIIEKYNPVTDTWTFLIDINCESVQDIITVNGEIFIIEHNNVKLEDSEGEDKKQDAEQNKQIKIQKYNPVNNTITILLEEGLNWRYFNTIVLGEEIYFIGGKKGRDISSGVGGGTGGFYVDNICMSYNPATNKWKGKTPIYKDYVLLDLAVSGDKIYAITKHQDKIGIVFYDSNTDNWYKSGINLMDRNNVKLEILKNNMIALGGAKVATAFILPDVVSNAVEVINLNSILKYGDVNQDGFIDSIDYILIKKYVLGIITEFPNDVEKLVADVNKDGKIDSSDLAILKKYILNIIDSF